MSSDVINRKKFGKKIKDAREKLDFTQYALADEVGLSQNFLGDIERGKKLPSLPKLIEICNVLKLSLDSLFADSLDNILCEPENIYYTDKQLTIIHNVIKSISDNFDN